jgi:UDP-glucose 4-epimerase
MIGVIGEVTGHTGRAPEVAPRRPGDPARVVASADAIAKELGWTARFGVRDMVASAWAGWQARNPG